MARVIICVGISGVGKTSILTPLAADYKVVNMGSEMLEVAKEEYGLTNRDEIREYHRKNLDKEIKLRGKILRRISAMGEDIILDTHVSVKVGNRFTPGFNMDDIKTLEGLKAIIYIDASTKEILARRRQDLSRARTMEEDEDISNHREINLSLVSTYAAILGIPIYIIENNNGKLERSKSLTRQIVKDIFG